MIDIDRMSSIYPPYILRISSSLKNHWRCKLASAEAPFLRDLKTRIYSDDISGNEFSWKNMF
jgi:hypothetical protein